MSIAVDQKKWGPEYVQGVAPSNPTPGQTWYDTEEKRLKVYNYVNTLDNIQDLSLSDHFVGLFGGVKTSKLGTEIIGPCSIEFDGSNDYLAVDDSSDWELTTSTDYTIDFWLKLTRLTGSSQVLIQQYEDSSNYWTLYYVNDGSLTFDVVSGGGSIVSITTGTSVISNTNFNHIAIVKNSTIYTIYVNGENVGTTTDASTDTLTGNLYIGQHGDNSLYLEGYLDEIRVSQEIDRTTDTDDQLYIDGNYHGNSGTLFLDNFTSISGWSDNDAGDGASTLSGFGGTDGCVKLDSGSAGAGNYAELLQDIGSIPTEFVATIKIYCDAIGTLSNTDYFYFHIRRPDMMIAAKFQSDGLFIFDGATWNEVGTNVVIQDTWQTWEFVVDATTAATSTCDVYLNGTLIASSVDCSYIGSFADGETEIISYGLTSANMITYVDYIKVGKEMEFSLPNDHYTADASCVLLIQPEGGAYWHGLPIAGGSGEFGYSLGGFPAALSDEIERMRFPFNSGVATLLGNLQNTATYSGGYNSSLRGYSCGNRTGTFASYIQRIDFPFQGGNADVVGNLNYSTGMSSGCNSSNYGYSCGGEDIDDSMRSYIQRLTFPHDAGTTTQDAYLGYQTRGSSACNSSTYGYVSAGQVPSTVSTITRFLFPFNSGTASNVGNLSNSHIRAGGCNSSTHGFSLGGLQQGNIWPSYIQRFTFPFDSGTATVVANLNISKEVSCFNSSVYGYSTGGYNNATYYSTIERFLFPFASGSTTSVGNLSSTKYGMISIDETDFVTQFI